MRLAALPVHRDRPPRPVKQRRPDATLATFAAAFFLGIVVAAAALLGLQASRGDTVPARVHQAAVADLAAERAGREAAAAQVVDQGDALEAAGVLARRLVDALGSPPVSADELAELRREVARQSVTIERIRVVRVPVPGPVVTVAPSPAAAPADRAQPARQQQTATPTPAPSAASCTVAVLSACLVR